MNTRLAWLFVGLLLSLSAHAQPLTLGRVFTTPQERLRLDRLREEQFAELQASARESSDVLVGTPIVEDLPTIVHMGGSLRRRDGSNSVWLNGVSVREEDLPSNARLEFSNGLGVLKIKTISGELTVRPGQTLNASTGELREDYELTAEQAIAVNEEVARRIEASKPVISSAAVAGQEPDGQESAAGLSDSQQETVRTIVETLRLLEAARDAQGGAP